jgi:hypothetical protein
MDANVDQLLQGGMTPEPQGGMITMEVTPQEAQMIEQMRSSGAVSQPSPEMQIDRLMQGAYQKPGV